MTKETTFRTLALGSAFAVIQHIASCGLVADVPITSLVPKSDAIVVATVAQGTIVNGIVSATLSVERTLKGNTLQQSAVAVTWKSSRPRHGTFTLRPHRGLFFLHRESMDPWTIIPATDGDVMFEQTFFFLPTGLPLPTFTPGEAGSVLDQVLLYVVWSSDRGRPPGGASPDLLGEYRRSHSDALKQVFLRYGASSSPALVATGLAALLGDGDIGALHRVEADQATLGKVGYILDEIRWRFSNPDSGAVEILGRLVANPNTLPGLREAAVGCLARLHTRQALTYIAPLLDDPSPTLRTHAVYGLSSFANNARPDHSIAPGDWRYRTDETIRHSAVHAGNVDFWRTWWQANKSDILQGR